MAEFLSQEWLDELRSDGAGSAGEHPTVVQHNVSGAPTGNVAYVTKIVAGQVVEAALGKAAEPDVTLTLSYEDAARIDSGELDLAVAFMQGNLKAEGDMRSILALLQPTSV